jgi:hypothetical protein
MAESVRVIGGQLDSVGSVEMANVSLDAEAHPWASNPGNILPTHTSFCHYAAPRYGKVGATGWHIAASIVAVALFIWGIYEQLKIFNMRYGIAKAYANIAQDQWVRFTQRYQPLENAMILSLRGSTPIKPDYQDAHDRALSWGVWSWAAADSDRAWFARKYRVCPDPSRAWDAARGIGLDDGINFSYREAEAFAIKHDELRWNQRAQLLNLGRNNQAIGAQYASAAERILGPVAQGAANMTGGALATIGYLYDRNMLTFGPWFTQSTEPGMVTQTENKGITNTTNTM